MNTILDISEKVVNAIGMFALLIIISIMIVMLLALDVLFGASDTPYDKFMRTQL